MRPGGSAQPERQEKLRSVIRLKVREKVLLCLHFSHIHILSVAMLILCIDTFETFTFVPIM